MKILIISSYLPFPLHSGGHIRLYNLIKNLSKDNEITLICERRDFQTDEDVKEVEKICKKVVTVKRKKQWSIENILKTGFSTNPFLITGHTSEEMQTAIKDEMVRETFDLIHVETFYVFQNLPKVTIPVVLVEHNVEYLVYKRYASLLNPLVKPLLLIDVAKIKQKEEQAWNKATKLVAVSNIEKKIMKRENVSVIPNGVDTEKFKFRDFMAIPQEKRVLFIGDFKWLQNRDSLEFILKEIWPKVIDKFSQLNKDFNLKLWVVGRNLPDSLKELGLSSVTFDSNNKEETWEIFRKSFILLAPFRAAGGTSYKILEAMSSGVGIVTTNLGIEGLEAKNQTHVLAAETADELANCVVDLALDPSLYRKLTINSRKFVEQNYDWKIISDKLNKIYMSSL
ncbi:MAG: glycosyltransferase family 4 protein [Candidatus Levybacteria bacterium]|nr:glycosyltransferase family 4 protein [Candidatus Levybacteria bacterium]